MSFHFGKLLVFVAVRQYVVGILVESDRARTQLDTKEEDSFVIVMTANENVISSAALEVDQSRDADVEDTNVENEILYDAKSAFQTERRRSLPDRPYRPKSSFSWSEKLIKESHCQGASPRIHSRYLSRSQSLPGGEKVQVSVPAGDPRSVRHLSSGDGIVQSAVDTEERIDIRQEATVAPATPGDDNKQCTSCKKFWPSSYKGCPECVIPFRKSQLNLVFQGRSAEVPNKVHSFPANTGPQSVRSENLVRKSPQVANLNYREKLSVGQGKYLSRQQETQFAESYEIDWQRLDDNEVMIELARLIREIPSEPLGKSLRDRSNNVPTDLRDSIKWNNVLRKLQSDKIKVSDSHHRMSQSKKIKVCESFYQIKAASNNNNDHDGHRIELKFVAHDDTIELRMPYIYAVGDLATKDIAAAQVLLLFGLPNRQDPRTDAQQERLDDLTSSEKLNVKVEHIINPITMYALMRYFCKDSKVLRGTPIAWAINNVRLALNQWLREFHGSLPRIFLFGGRDSMSKLRDTSDHEEYDFSMECEFERKWTMVSQGTGPWYHVLYPAWFAKGQQVDHVEDEAESNVQNEEAHRIGNFVIEKKLGQGTFGIVYKGHREGEEHQKYAIKQLKNIKNVDQQHAAVQEAAILRPIRHKHIIKYIDTFNDEYGILYVVFEYANRGDLRQFIRRQTSKNISFSSSEVSTWFTQIVHGMAFLRHKNIMHRDVKPANIVLQIPSYSNDFVMKIADFGLAKEIEGGKESASTHVGTQLYMSPECLNQGKYSFQNDVWALGCVLYEMCALTRAFENIQNVFVIKLSMPVPTKSNTEGSVNAWDKLKDLRKICSSILVEDPNARPTCNQLLTMMFELRMGQHDTPIIQSSSSAGGSTLAVVRKLSGPLFRTNINYIDWFESARDGYLDAVFMEAFLGIKGTDVNAKANGSTALHVACHEDHHHVVQILLSHSDVDVNMGDAQCQTALHVVSARGHHQVAKFLLSHSKIEVNKCGSGSPALYIAASRGHYQVVGHLLSHPEIQVNYHNDGLQTALYTASENGHHEAVKLLVAHPEIHVNLIDYRGYSALYIASYTGNHQIVRHLLNHSKLHVNGVTDHGETALQTASRWNHPQVVQLLLSHSALKVNKRLDGETALLIASQLGHHHVVERLLSHSEVDVTKRNSLGKTALHLACENGHEPVVKHLVSHLS